MNASVNSGRPCFLKIGSSETRGCTVYFSLPPNCISSWCGCKLLSVKLKTEFPASAPAWRKTSPEGRESRHAGRANPGIYGNAAVQWRTTACHDGNLKCSVIRGIVRLSTTKPTIMTEQDKITIFDAIINPFLCHTPSPGTPVPKFEQREKGCSNHAGCRARRGQN